MKESLVSFESVSFQYDTLPILEDVSFNFFSGELYGVIGPNGGGKTTLLKLMTKELQPLAGQIKFKDDLRISYVPQKLKIGSDFPLSALEVVQGGIVSTISGWPAWFNKSHQKYAYQALEKVGMSDFANRHIGALSGGQLQRVLIARALISNSDLLILDESFSMLDKAAKENLLEVIFNLEFRPAIILVSHEYATLKEFKEILYVDRTVEKLDYSQICDHYSIGVFHAPNKGNSTC